MKAVQMNMKITETEELDEETPNAEEKEDSEISNIEEIENIPVIKKIKYLTKQRLCALMTLLAFIINTFSPYGLLLQPTYAASEQVPLPGEPYYKLSITPIDGTVDYDDWDDATNYYYYDFDPDTDTIESYSGTRLITMTLTVNGCDTVNAGTIYFKYDSSKLIPASEVNKGTNKKPIWVIEEAETYEDFAETGWGLPVIELLDTNISTIGLEGGVSPGGDKYISDGELVATFTFKLADGIKLEDLTEDVMALNTTYSSIYPTGLKIPYFKDGVSVFVNQPYYLVYEGFATNNKKTITGITLNSNMDKTKYYTGENIDFTGASITIQYDDGSTDVITDISKAVTDGLITIDSTKATTSKKVVVTAGGETCDLNYNIATSITVSKNPTTMTYDHDDTINFAGGTINVVYDNGDTVPLDINTGITSKLLTVDKTKADVNNKTVTFTYVDGKLKTSINLTVNDPIVSIAITSNPTTTTYDHGDTIDLTGGTIEATKKSGAKVSGISMKDPKVSTSSTTADINSCTSKWQNGELTAGSQDIIVTYENKTAKFSVVVNDTISSIVVKTQPTAKNKYGTEGNSLNLTGAQLEVTTSSNNKFTTNINVGMLNLTGYNKQTLTTQNLPVTYGGLTTSTGNGVNIKLKDYITGITVTAPNNLTANYNTELDLTGVTYVKNYAGGASSSSLPVTKSMISGYNKTPTASSFNANHEYPETITVTLNTPDDADIDTIPVNDTFNVKVIDTVTGIQIAQRPNKTSYNYGETFSATGGRVQLSYASGATASSSVSMLDANVKITETDDSPINMNPSASSFTNGRATKTLKVTYTDPSTSQKYSANLQNIFVNDVLDTIQIGTTPKIIFNHGDTFSVGSGTLELIYKSGNTSTIDLDDGTTIKETATGTAVNMTPLVTEYIDNSLTKNLTVTYTEGQVTKTVDYDITINNPIDNIAIGTSPKTNYNLNEPKDVTGTITVTRKAGNTSTVNITDSMVTGLDTTVAGTNKTATVTYTEDGVTKTTTYNYNVVDSITGITIGDTPKTNYKYNEPLDVSTGTINVIKGSGTTNIPMTSGMVTELDGSPFDSTNLTPRNLLVTYSGKTAQYAITVKDYVTGIRVHPNSVTGDYGTELEKLIDDNLIKYVVTYAKTGDQTPEELTKEMVQGYDKTSTTTQKLKVKYTDNDANSFTNGKEFESDLTIELEDEITGINMSKLPTNRVYGYNDTSVDLTGGEITVVWKSGKTDTVTLPSTDVTITETDGTPLNLKNVTFGADNTATKTVQVNYKGKKTIYTVAVVNKVTGIAMKDIPKTSYNVGESLDITTDNGITPGTIEVTREYGPKETVNLTPSMVTGFASNVENTALSLTVSYTENNVTKTTNYTVSVKDSVNSIAIKDTPKTNYKYNEPLDVSTGTIDVTKGSGTTNIPMNSSMVTELDGSPFDSSNLTPRELLVTYGGKTDRYSITVKDYVTGIRVQPDNITGEFGAELEKLIDDNLIKYVVTYAKVGDQTPETLTKAMVPGYNKTSTTTQNLKVKYTDNDTNSFTEGKEFEADLTIELEDKITGITLTTPPTKDEYGYNDTSVDLTGGELTITWQSGKTDTVSLPSPDVTTTETDGNPLDLKNVTFGPDNTAVKTVQLNYKGQKTTYTVTVINKITGITMKDTPKTNYNVGESLDITTDNGTTPGTIEVTREYGPKETVNLTPSMVTGFASNVENTALSLTVSYTENNVTKTTDYTVSVRDSVNSIAIKDMPKIKYKYNEPLDVSTGTLDVTKGSGTTNIPMTTNMVTELDGSPFDSTNLTPRKLLVTYGGQTVQYDITIEDYVTGIVLVPPTRTTCEYGENIDFSTGTVQKVMASGIATTPVALTDNDVTLSTFDNTHIGRQNIDVTYEGFTESFEVIVENNITTITIKDTPKQTYKFGENLDVTGGTITITRANGAEETVTITPNMVTGFNPNQLGKQTLTVTYDGKTTSYDINVEDYIDRIEIKQPNKLIYDLNETPIDLTGGTVTAVMASGTATTPVDMSNPNVTISGFNTSSEGAKIITVEYEGKQETFGITVVDSLRSMVIATLPDKKVYKYGESLDLTGGTIEIEKGSGAKEVIPMTSSMVSGYNPKQLGNQTLTVTYGKFTQEFIVRVDDYISHLKVTPPDKVEYEYGEDLNLKGGKVSIVTASGAIEESIQMTASMISGYNKTAEGTQNIEVEYKGLKGNFNVNVVDKIKAISMNNYPNKVNYKYDENLDLTGATINVVKSSGIYKVTVTDDMISGFNSKRPGTQVITVTYAGFTTNFTVNVAKQQKPQQPQKPTKPNKPTVSKPVEEPVVEEPIIEKPIIEEPVTPIEPPVVVEPEPEEKPTIVLGEKDEKDNNDEFIKILAIGMSGLGLLLLLILLASRRNVEIYVYEDGEFVLAGKEKIKKNEPYIDIDEYLDGNTYDNQVIVSLNKSISKKLDEESIRIKHRGATAKYKIKYNNEPYEIVLN